MITTEYFTELDNKVKKKHKEISRNISLICYGFGFSVEESKAFLQEARYNYTTSGARRV